MKCGYWLMGWIIDLIILHKLKISHNNMKHVNDPEKQRLESRKGILDFR